MFKRTWWHSSWQVVEDLLDRRQIDAYGLCTALVQAGVLLHDVDGVKTWRLAKGATRTQARAVLKALALCWPCHNQVVHD